MEALVFVLVVVFVLAVGVLAWERLRGGREQPSADMAQMLNMTQQNLAQRIDALDQRLSQNLNAVQQTVSRSMASTQETIGQVGQQLGRLEQSSKQMLEVGQDIGQLQDILRPPKMRGGFGELLLENLLSQILPPENYGFQHRFRSGEMVDAVIRLGSGLVPIDSKFPLESFNRVVAAESEEESLSAYALARRVIPVSPNSFYGYLQAIVLGLKGLRVEERAREIIDHLARLGKEFGRFREEFDVLGTHVGRAKTKYDDLDKRVGRMSDRLLLPLQEEWDRLPPGEEVEREG